MPITHVFSDSGSTDDDLETYLVLRDDKDGDFNPFKEQSYVQA